MSITRGARLTGWQPRSRLFRHLVALGAPFFQGLEVSRAGMFLRALKYLELHRAIGNLSFNLFHPPNAFAGEAWPLYLAHYSGLPLRRLARDRRESFDLLRPARPSDGFLLHRPSISTLHEVFSTIFTSSQLNGEAIAP